MAKRVAAPGRPEFLLGRAGRWATRTGSGAAADLSGPGRQVIQNRVELGWEARVVRHKHP